MTPVMLKRADVVKLVGLSYSTIHRLEGLGKFPARKQLSTARVGWLHSEVEEWIKGRLTVV